MSARIAGLKRRWETVGAIRRKGDALEIGIGGVLYVIRREDAPGLIVEGTECDIYQLPIGSSDPWVVGRASWSESGRMLILSLPGKHGLVQVAGAHICAHYLREERGSIDVVRPPAPVPEARVPTPLPPGVRLGVC